MSNTEQFIQRIEKIAVTEIPSPVLARAHMALIDYIAVTSAGAKANQKKLENYLEIEQPESGNFTLIGMDRKINLKDAVFLNGLNAHALDFDDGTNEGIIHLGSPIFSVLIPLAQKYSISIAKMLYAAVIGYETSFTIATSIQPTHKMMGFHATGTCGVLGIAMAVSYLLDFTPEERRAAFAIAAVSASGMLKVIDDESDLKPYNVAKSSLLGLVAIQMVKMGFKGHHDVFDGDRGFLKMMTGREDLILKNPLLYGTYAIEKTYIKPYAACRYCHPSIEAAITFKDKLDYTDIREIIVSTYDLAVKKHDHTEIKGISSAKMSIPYGVASGLMKGKAGLEEYDENHTTDMELLNLAKKVKVLSDKEMTASFPIKTPARIEVRMNDNTVFAKRIDYPKGEPENPMGQSEFQDRIIELLTYSGKSEEKGMEIIHYCKNPTMLVTNLCEHI